MRMQGLLSIERILTRHMRAAQLVCFTKIQLRAYDEHRKEKAVTQMLKENANFRAQRGLEKIERNHHQLNRVLFARVSHLVVGID